MKLILYSILFPIVLTISIQTTEAQQSTDKITEQLTPYLPAKASVKPKHSRNVLVFNCLNSYYHAEAVDFTSKAFELLGTKTGAYTATVSSDPSVFEQESLSKFDAVVLNNFSLSDNWGEFPASEQRKLALINFVKSGKGLIVIHAASVGGGKVSDSEQLVNNSFLEMIGGNLVQHSWNYDEKSPLTVKIEDVNHPICATFEGKDKWLLPFRDEIYQFSEVLNRENVRVLFSLSMEETADKGSQPNKDYPLSWISNYGKGRVFHSALGHSGDSFRDTKILTFLLAGTQFALGDLKCTVKPIPQQKPDLEKGFVSIFNGKDLTGWRGESRIWSVEDGCITGQTTDKEHVDKNNYLIWEGGDLKDFELKAKFKLNGGNSGIYFHSFERTPDAENQESLVGVQADFSADHVWVGTIMEYKLREVLAPRGRKVVINEDGKRIDAGSTGDSDELLKVYKENEWNDYHVIVRDNLILLRINDVVMSEIRDYDKARLVSGLLALQVHVGPAMKVQFKDIRIKKY